MTRKVNIRGLYEWLAEIDKRFGEDSTRAVPVLFKLLSYFERIDDDEGKADCLNWLDRVSLKHPHTGKTIRARLLSLSASSKSRLRRHRKKRESLVLSSVI